MISFQLKQYAHCNAHQLQNQDWKNTRLTGLRGKQSTSDRFSVLAKMFAREPNTALTCILRRPTEAAAQGGLSQMTGSTYCSIYFSIDLISVDSQSYENTQQPQVCLSIREKYITQDL